VVIEGAEDYETFIKTLNEVVKKYAVKHHKHRHGAQETENSGDGAGV
jgi:hypothetical protein